MLKKKVDGLEDYYYQWMNKYKDDADRRLKMLRAAHLHMVAIGEHDYCNHHDEECLICNIAKELADE